MVNDVTKEENLQKKSHDGVTMPSLVRPMLVINHLADVGCHSSGRCWLNFTHLADVGCHSSG